MDYWLFVIVVFLKLKTKVLAEWCGDSTFEGVVLEGINLIVNSSSDGVPLFPFLMLIELFERFGIVIAGAAFIVVVVVVVVDAACSDADAVVVNVIAGTVIDGAAIIVVVDVDVLVDDAVDFDNLVAADAEDLVDDADVVYVVVDCGSCAAVSGDVVGQLHSYCTNGTMPRVVVLLLFLAALVVMLMLMVVLVVTLML